MRIRAFIFSALCLVSTVCFAQTQENRTSLYSEIDTKLPSNGAGSITAADLRLVFKDLVASAHNILTDGTAVISTDPRLSDARTPLAHAASHAAGGSDPLTLTEAQITNLGTDLAGKAALSHTHTASQISDSTVVGRSLLTAADAPTARSAIGAGTSSFDGTWLSLSGKPTFATVATTGAYSDLSGKPTLGTSAALDVPATGDASTAQVVKGTDSRLTNARTPTAHTHTEGDLVLSDVTTANASTTKHGFLPKLTGDATQFMNGTGAFSVPAGGGGGSSAPSSAVVTWTEDFIPNKSIPSTLPPQWVSETIVSGGSVGPIVTTAPHVGIERITTAATAGDGYAVHGGDNGGPSYTTLVRLDNVTNWDSTFIFRLGPVEGTTTNVSIRVGFYGLSAVADDPPNFIGLRYSTAKSDTTFMFVCRASSAETPASASAVDNGWHSVRIRSTSVGTVLFSMDGGAETPISTNLPSQSLQPVFQIVSQTTSAKTLDADYFSFYMTGLSR